MVKGVTPTGDPRRPEASSLIVPPSPRVSSRNRTQGERAAVRSSVAMLSIVAAAVPNDAPARELASLSNGSVPSCTSVPPQNLLLPPRMSVPPPAPGPIATLSLAGVARQAVIDRHRPRGHRRDRELHRVAVVPGTWLSVDKPVLGRRGWPNSAGSRDLARIPDKFLFRFLPARSSVSGWRACRGVSDGLRQGPAPHRTTPTISRRATESAASSNPPSAV